MTKITNIEDARALKAENLPLDLPVEHRTFSPEYTRHWVRLMDAHGSFVRAINDYVAGPRAGSLGKWKLVRRRLTALDNTRGECLAFLSKLGGDVEPLVFKSEQDGHEHDVLRLFLSERAAPFIQYWGGVIDAVDAGVELQIEPGDIPPWID
jgi:hypothetical protein